MTDTLESGQTLNQDGFSIAVGNQNLTPQQFNDEGYGTITFNGNSFEVRIYKDQVSGKNFLFRYTSTVTDSGMKQKNFYNNYTINYQILNEQPVTFSEQAGLII